MKNLSSMNSHKMITISIVMVAIVAIGFGGYFYYQLQQLQKNPQASALQEKNDLIARVSRLYLVPTDEEPTIATVSDPHVLSNQEFFAQSMKDDKVLIYTNAKKAILYRPSIDKIIATAPVTSGATSAPNTASTATTTVTPPKTSSTSHTKVSTKK